MKIPTFQWPVEFVDAEPGDADLASVIATLGVPAKVTWEQDGDFRTSGPSWADVVLAPDRPWELFVGQTGGNACNHPALIGMRVPLEDGVRRAFDAIARRWLGTQIYFPETATLEEVSEYARQVEAAGLTCATAYRDFHEALYPVDPTPANLRRLCGSSAHDSTFRAASRAGVVPWRLWIWGPNSD